MAYPPVVVVDDNDNPIGEEMLQEIWKRGLRHRIVGIVVFDGHGNILLQKRSAQMELEPNKWDISAAGHVDDGHSYDVAAELEMQEELGLRDVQLVPYGTVKIDSVLQWRKINRFVKMYRAIVPDTSKLRAGEEEVSKVQWLSPQEFRHMLQETPEDCAALLRQSYAQVPDLFEPLDSRE